MALWHHSIMLFSFPWYNAKYIWYSMICKRPDVSRIQLAISRFWTKQCDVATSHANEMTSTYHTTSYENVIFFFRRQSREHYYTKPTLIAWQREHWNSGRWTWVTCWDESSVVPMLMYFCSFLLWTMTVRFDELRKHRLLLLPCCTFLNSLSISLLMT